MLHYALNSEQLFCNKHPDCRYNFKKLKLQIKNGKMNITGLNGRANEVKL